MEELNVLLKGVARVLNAGGSALVNIYDAVTSTRIGAPPGEKEKLKEKMREYTSKVDRLYYEIGKEVSKPGEVVQISAAGEASIRLVAEYREHVEEIRQRIEEIEAAERIERQRLLEEREAARRVRGQEAEKEVVVASKKTAPRVEAEKETTTAESEPVVIAQPFVAEAPETGEVTTDVTTEEEELVEAEMRTYPELPEEIPAVEAPVATEESPGVEAKEDADEGAKVLRTKKKKAHKYTADELESLLKSDLLSLCMEKGIEADKRMTKAAIIELILARRPG